MLGSQGGVLGTPAASSGSSANTCPPMAPLFSSHRTESLRGLAHPRPPDVTRTWRPHSGQRRGEWGAGAGGRAQVTVLRGLAMAAPSQEAVLLPEDKGAFGAWGAHSGEVREQVDREEARPDWPEGT